MLARLKANVLVLGAGALGSPVIEHLAKAGIGHITIVDNDTFESANLGRHLLGVDAIDERKSEAVAARVMHRHPSCFISSERNTVERWLLDHDLRNFDLVVDLTGDPDVRWAVDRARRMSPCPLLIGWMEPFVAAAHVCNLPATVFWINDIAKPLDRMSELEAVTWPGEVVRQEPGCSSRFQAYTAVQAGYAIALVAERLIQVIDDNPQTPQVRSWVRGQAFLDQHWTGLQLREWARAATQHDGVMITRDFT
ncbi:ThiF family adenylyltransferase [Bordetella bronchialis]|uniref:ThiF family adenylyltransferase n=1 Tax=Bordetella bronchialis TaxID=463025 RepID=UPI003CFCE25B